MEKASKYLSPSWVKAIGAEFEKPYMQTLKDFLRDERANFQIYPKPQDVFAAFSLTSFNDVRVVILGQDPYHGPNQAHGLAFSVQDGVKIPPSLRNIFKELNQQPAHGNLTKWAQQGVLLLNTTLTVREGSPASHTGKGWERFTDAVIATLSSHKEGLVFMLWGKHAQSKSPLINFNKHTILKAPHPSPLSASKGFFGSNHFQIANEVLSNSIDWSL